MEWNAKSIFWGLLSKWGVKRYLRGVYKTSLGDVWGGFIALDKITMLRTEVMWAKLLMKLTRNSRPSVINILEGERSFELQIWWEIPPSLVEIYHVSGRAEAKIHKEEEDVGERMAKHVEFFPPKRNDSRLKRQKDVSKSGNGKGPIVVEGITSRTAEEGEVKCGSLMGS